MIKKLLFGLVFLLCLSAGYGAIAFDNSASASSSTSTTVSTSMTVSGSNKILFVSVSDFGGDTVTAVTFNGDPLTQINKTILSGGTFQYLYYMVAPDTGTHTLEATRGSTTSTFKISASSYTGVSQTNPILNNGANSVTSAGSVTTTLNSISDNAWAVNGVGSSRGLTASTGVTERATNTDNVIGDSGSAITPVQNYGMTWTLSSSGNAGSVMAIFAQAQDISFDNISLNGANLINDTILNTSIGEFNINLSVDGTNSDVNTSYFLYNSTSGSLINTSQFGTSTLQPNVTLGFDTGNYSISFFAENNQTNKSTGNFTFAVDTVAPLLSVTNNTEINFYNMSFDSIINVSDGTTSFTCLVTIDEGNVTQCNSTFYNWTTNGNHTFNVSVNDSAGNTAQSNNNRVFVNPNQKLNFFNSISGSPVTSYSVTIDGNSFSTSSNPLEFPIYDVGLGTKEVIFNNLGFDANQSFNITLNTTSNLNQSFNVTPVTLTMQMFNFSNISQQVSFDILIINSTDIANFTDQLTLVKNFNEIPTGIIQMEVSNSSFVTTNFYNEITPFSSIIVKGYLIEDTINAETIIFNVLDFQSNSALANVTLEAQRTINGTFQTVSMGKTDGTGQTFMVLDNTLSYKILISKDGYTSASIESIPGVTSYTIRLKKSGAQFQNVDDVDVNFLPGSGPLFFNQSYNLQQTLVGTSISLSNVNIILSNGTLINQNTSTSATGSTFSFPFNTSLYPNATSVLVSLNYIRNGNVNQINKSYDIVSFNTSSELGVIQQFSETNSTEAALLRWFILAIVFASTLFAGTKINEQFGLNRSSIPLLILIPIAFFWFVSWIPTPYAVIAGLGAIALYLGSKGGEI